MGVLLIKNEQDLIFKSKSSLIIGKQKEKKLQNSFASNTIKGEIVTNRKLSNFIKLYFGTFRSE